MSAIWGAIDLNDGTIEQDVKLLMEESYKDCVIDRTSTIDDGAIYMGCGIQYFTPESKYETLPFKNNESDYYLNADIVLDNRTELCNKLSVEENSELPDGTILKEMISSEGMECLKTLTGAYAFATYMPKQKKIDLVIDAVGTRCLYYYLEGSVVYFSTLIEPLRVLSNAKINKRWISDFLAMDNMFMFTDMEETQFEGIYRIAPGQRVSITPKEVNKETYWKPLDTIGLLKLDSDSEYREIFRNVFRSAVEGMVRNPADKTGLLLSGGLDSTAVAVFADEFINSNGGAIQAYTSVPEEDFNSDNQTGRVLDEGDIALKTVASMKCASGQLIQMPNINPWDEHARIMRYLEMPYKNFYNVLWLEKSMVEAKKKGIRLMLTGGYGNSSISFSNVPVYFNDLMISGKWLTLYKEIQLFHKKMRFSRKLMIVDTIKSLLFSKKYDIDSDVQKSFMFEEIWKQYDTINRVSSLYNEMSRAGKRFSTYRHQLWHPRAHRQIGEMETKRSLATGVLLRDPTRDKRVIEFCMSLPIDQFSKNGEVRRLINNYMSDLMPKHILKVPGQGKQGGDFQHRMRKQWSRLKDEWKYIYIKYSKQSYIDTYKAIDDLEKIEIDTVGSFKLMKHMYYLSTLEFVEKYKKE